MTSKRLHNPNRHEKVFDDAGHIIAAGESITVENVDGTTKTLIERGELIVSDAKPSLRARRNQPNNNNSDEPGDGDDTSGEKP